MPAATIVAAWISADTGVGPAIASGSHVYRGNWADLPIVPPNMSKAAAVIRSTDTCPPATVSLITWMFEVVIPVAYTRAKMPNMNGTQPTRERMNPLIAADELRGSSYQRRLHRYEQTPMISHPTSSSNRFDARTTTSIAPVNIDSTK